MEHIQRIYETSFWGACSAKDVEILKNLRNYWGSALLGLITFWGPGENTQIKVLGDFFDAFEEVDHRGKLEIRFTRLLACRCVEDSEMYGILRIDSTDVVFAKLINKP